MAKKLPLNSLRFGNDAGETRGSKEKKIEEEEEEEINTTLQVYNTWPVCVCVCVNVGPICITVLTGIYW